MIEMGIPQDFYQGKEIISISVSGMKAVAGNNVIQVGPRYLRISPEALTAGQVTQLNTLMGLLENMKMSTNTDTFTTDQTAQLQTMMGLFKEMQQTTSNSE